MDPKILILFVLATLAAGYCFPGGGFLVVVAALSTRLRRSRRTMVILIVLAGVLGLIALVTFVGNFIPPVAHVR